ncbi:MAG: glycosyltransferase family 2 protein [Planctomycetota bacterium]
MDAWLPWVFGSVVTLAAMVWAYINYGGFGKSLRYQLPQPEEDEEGLPLDASDSSSSSDELPWVAIVSPGRNEAKHLPTVLPELCSQDYPNLQVVFIDDASTDETQEIAGKIQDRFDNLMVCHNMEEPPAGWMGKCWAIQHGVNALRYLEVVQHRQEQTSNSERRPPQIYAVHHDEFNEVPSYHYEWLCFTDADIHWHPKLLRTAIAHAEEHDTDLLGVTPTLRFGSAGEAIVQLQLVLALGLMLPFEKAMDPDSPVALTGGAFILVRRKFYEQIGGHTAVKGEMVEDLKLGAALKAAGAKHRVATAGELQWCRMYDGWADMWEGLTKNAYAGLGHRWWVAAGVVLATLLLNVGPVVYALASAAWLALSPGWLPGATLLVSLLTVAWQARALNAGRKLMNMPWPYAWTLPIGSAAYAAIIIASVAQYHTKGNAWKGRRYSSADAAA